MSAPFTRDQQIELIRTLDERIAVREHAWKSDATVRHILRKTQGERECKTVYSYTSAQVACA